MRADAVFEGGGIKGIGLVGAVTEAEAQGYRWVNLAGTSAGAIIAALLAAGYTGTELAAILRRIDYRQFRDAGWLTKVPYVGPGLSIIFKLGIYEGDRLERWLASLLAERGVQTFRDLIIPEFADDPQYRYRLRVIATDLTQRRLLIFPQDSVRFGVSPDQLSVARAVRMSMSIPFYFRPIRFTNRLGGPDSFIVDGGVLSNFPVWLFDTPSTPPWPTFGFKIVEPGEGAPSNIRGPIGQLAALVATMLEAHDARYIEDADFVRTIGVPSTGVGTVEFDLTPERADRLFAAGQAAAAAFFETWDFTTYIKRHRNGGPTPGRGRRLRAKTAG